MAMAHPTYEIVQANGWWGPEPSPRSVAVVEQEGPNEVLTLLTIATSAREYDVFACMHPCGLDRRETIQQLETVYYSPKTAGIISDHTPLSGITLDVAYAMERSAFVHHAARLRHSWGLSNLHYLAEGLQHTLRGTPLKKRDQRLIDAYGQPCRATPSKMNAYGCPGVHEDTLPPSPFTPHGIWTYVAPDHPFDFRVRATCTIPRTAANGILEELAQRAANVRDLPGFSTRLLAHPEEPVIFEPLPDTMQK